MPKIIVVALQKGGVGKTTTIQHLGHALAMLGRTVLLVDLDPQSSLSRRYDVTRFHGSLADVFGADGAPTATLREVVVKTYQPNLYLAPAHSDLSKSDKRLRATAGAVFAVRRVIAEARLPFDYILLDTPPGRSAMLDAALFAGDEIVIPVQLSAMGFEGFQGIDETIQEARSWQRDAGQPIRLFIRAVVPTFYSKGQIVSDEYLAELEAAPHPDYADQRLPLAPEPIPETTAFERASVPIVFETEQGEVVRGRTIFEMRGDGPTRRGQRAYRKLARWIDGRT